MSIKSYNIDHKISATRTALTVSRSGTSKSETEINNLKYRTRHLYQISNNSPRVNGRLVLKSNAFYRTDLTEDYTLGSQKTTRDDYWYWPYASPKPTSLYIVDTPYGVDTINYKTGNLGVKDQAVLAFYNDIAAAKINLAVAIKERQQTVNLVANKARQIASVLSHLKRGRFSAAAHDLGLGPGVKAKSRGFGNQWLELQYGWKPLLSDIHGALTATVDRPLTRPIKITRQGSVSDTIVSGESTHERSYEERVTVKGFASLSSTVLSKGAELGLTNPALVAWEIVPYSFVVDWFIPVGDWLQAQSALHGVSVTDVSVTTTIEQKTKTERTMVTYPSPMITYSGSSAKASGRKRKKTRSLGLPSIPSPTFSLDLNLSQAISAVSLINQRFNR